MFTVVFIKNNEHPASSCKKKSLTGISTALRELKSCSIILRGFISAKTTSCMYIMLLTRWSKIKQLVKTLTLVVIKF